MFELYYSLLIPNFKNTHSKIAYVIQSLLTGVQVLHSTNLFLALIWHVHPFERCQVPGNRYNKYKLLSDQFSVPHQSAVLFLDFYWLATRSRNWDIIRISTHGCFGLVPVDSLLLHSFGRTFTPYNVQTITNSWFCLFIRRLPPF